MRVCDLWILNFQILSLESTNSSSSQAFALLLALEFNPVTPVLKSVSWIYAALQREFLKLHSLLTHSEEKLSYFMGGFIQ